MACFHPLTGFYTGCLTEKGCKEVLIVSGKDSVYSVQEAEKRLGHEIPYDSSLMMSANGLAYLNKPFPVACGHCLGCLSDRSQDWATRCCLELEGTDGPSWFVTLTMDDEHLGPLDKAFIQRFLKRLRHRFGPFRYLLSAEYGEKTGRPHYHAIFFGLSVPDLRPWSKSGKFPLFRSASFEACYGLGACLFGSVSFDSCAYVAKYATKAQAREGCFLLMSRRPGLGSAGLRRMLDGFDGSDGRFVGDFGGKHVVRAPRLFKGYLRDSSPDVYSVYSANVAAAAQRSAVSDSVIYSVDDLDFYREALFKYNRRRRS